MDPVPNILRILDATIVSFMGAWKRPWEIYFATKSNNFYESQVQQLLRRTTAHPFLMILSLILDLAESRKLQPID